MKTTEEAAEMVLRAAGSSLKNYTMPATREAILKAVTELQDDAYRASIESINGFIQQNKKLRSVLSALVKAVETQDEDSLFELKDAHEILGSTSVIRPTERKVPEVVERLRQFSCQQLANQVARGDGINTYTGQLAAILAGHFEGNP